MSIARRVELRVVAIGGALPEDLTDRLLSATYTDNEEDAADRKSTRLNSSHA